MNATASRSGVETNRAEAEESAIYVGVLEQVIEKGLLPSLSSRVG